ncbi:putative RNA-directed DNA polymerase from transposon X-element [Trichonephila clavipes]|uniref:Putative RNA-directed DNA polymerase from transposon X-element n=1 Tax=Trichonephila clavipes TaxID=2585209 RepID=A0A8X6S5G6_TRICX|nr:putative RNA-directed DNA polymerase from transposon X-element [Trichonephila clavipes]
MRDFIDKHAPDIFLIQETHLRPEHSFKIPNYSCYRNDRTHPAPGRGGTVILIKNCTSHYHVPTPLQFTGVELTLIMLAPIDHEPILIGSTYIPPVNDYFKNLNAALDPIFNYNNMTILVGDFNAKHTSWGCTVSDTRGNRLHRYITNNNIDVLAPPTPTRTAKSPLNSILLGVSSRKRLQILKTATYRKPPQPRVRELTSEILTAHASASRPMTHSEPPFVQGELKHLFKERNRARKLWQFTKFPQHKTDLNIIQNKIKRIVGQYRQQVWEEHLTSLEAEEL